MASFRGVLAGGRFVSGPGQLVSGRGDLFWPAVTDGQQAFSIS